MLRTDIHRHRTILAVTAGVTFFTVLYCPTASAGTQDQHVNPDSTRPVGAALSGPAQKPAADIAIRMTPDGKIIAGELVFESLDEYAKSDFFKATGLVLRCGTTESFKEPEGALAGGGTSDCTANFTNPDDVYSPQVVKYRINVVVHVIQSATGQGYISPEMVQTQIDVLNGDFLAIVGTLGEPGTDPSDLKSGFGRPVGADCAATGVGVRHGVTGGPKMPGNWSIFGLAVSYGCVTIDCLD